MKDISKTIMMKRFFLIIVAIHAATCLWAYDFEVDGLWYNIISISDTTAYTAEVTHHPTSPYEASSITIPEKVDCDGNTYVIKRIGTSAFEDCYALTSVTIPNSITSIYSYAFKNCQSLNSINIPKSVVFIKPDAFSNSGIYNDESNWEDSVLYIGDCLIQAKRGLTGYYAIKEGTRLIANNAFAGSGITSTTIPNTVTDIGVGAFQYSALTSIIIPNGVTKIWGLAFYHCTSLKSVTLPNSITQIQRDAFRDCSALTTVICKAIQVPDCQHNIFANIPFLEATLYVPEESLEDYKSATYWKDFGTILPITQTGLENTQADNKASFIKVIRNGQLLILRDGKTYNAMGQEL
jgi:hypothetical protein